MYYNPPSGIAHQFAQSAQQKNSLSTSRLFVYSIMGGAFISLGGLLALIVAGGMPEIAASNPGITKFVFGAVFPLGLILVVIGGGELFTSDCAVISFGFFRRELKINHLIKLWSVVYIGNFIGALLVAYLFAYQTEILAAEPWLSATKNIGVTKTSAPFLKTFVKGIGANWLVCLAVWMAYAAKDVVGKSLAIWFPVMAFVAFGFEHSIANMFFIPAAMLLGADISSYQFLVVNLVPATLGNIVGGAIFVALAYHYMFPKTEPDIQLENAIKSKTKNFNGHAKYKEHLN